jgi:hypothetical protein
MVPAPSTMLIARRRIVMKRWVNTRMSPWRWTMCSATATRSSPTMRLAFARIQGPPPRPIQNAMESPTTAPSAPATMTSQMLRSPFAANTAATTIEVSPGKIGITPSPATSRNTAR